MQLLIQTHTGADPQGRASGTESLILPDGSVFAHMPGFNIQDDPESWIDSAEPGGRIVLGCGQLLTNRSAESTSRSWLTSWSEQGWEEFSRRFRSCMDLASQRRIGLLIRPSAEGMLSDAVCTLNWCTRGGGQDATLLLDPMGWIVPSMLRDLDDHLVRISELCQEMIDHGRVGGVVLRSCEVRDGEILAGRSLSDGSIDARLIVDRLGELGRRAGVGVLLDPEDRRILDD